MVGIKRMAKLLSQKLHRTVHAVVECKADPFQPISAAPDHFLRKSAFGPKPDNSSIPDSTLPQQAALVGVHMGSWPLITRGKSAASME